MKSAPLAISGGFLLLLINGVLAWQINGIPICDAPLEQSVPSIISDGKGGAIIIWDDGRNVSTNDYDIYAQRIDKDGNILWTPNGVNICSNSSFQYPNPGYSLVSDDSGGGIAVWTDLRNGNFDIYAQRFDSNGVTLWTPDGIPVCTASGNQVYAVMISDNSGGGIVAWYDRRSGQSVYAQRIDPLGNCLWSTNGVQIAAPPAVAVFEDVYRPLGVVPDGSGGAIIVWRDERSGSSLNGDVYAQRVDSQGNVLWTPSGVPVCTNNENQMNTAIAATINGDAIITWSDKRNGNYDIFAQRIAPDGNTQWAPDGIPVCDTTGNQTIPKITDDTAGGAIIAWIDQRSGQYLYAQRVDSSGNALWTPQGKLLCNTSDPVQGRHFVISDGAGGAIIVLSVSPSAPIVWDIFAQRVDPNGNLLWGNAGIRITQVDKNQMNPFATLTSLNDAVFVWFDQRDDEGDIYAQSAGYLAIEESPEEKPRSEITLLVNPNPSYNLARVRFYLPSEMHTSLRVFDAIGRFKSVLADGEFKKGWNEIRIDKKDLSSGVYFLNLKTEDQQLTRKVIFLRD